MKIQLVNEGRPPSDDGGEPQQKDVQGRAELREQIDRERVEDDQRAAEYHQRADQMEQESIKRMEAKAKSLNDLQPTGDIIEDFKA